MFSLFMVRSVGFRFFREHVWKTWARLRSSPVRPAELVVAKTAVPLLELLVYMGVLFTAGVLLFDLNIKGNPFALVLVAGAFACSLVSLGFLLVSVCRSIMQVDAIANLGAMLFVGLGGALTPPDLLPAWAQPLAPATPTYWAMRGFRAVILSPGESPMS